MYVPWCKKQGTVFELWNPRFVAGACWHCTYIHARRFEKVREENYTRKRIPVLQRKNMKYKDQCKINLLIINQYCPGVMKMDTEKMILKKNMIRKKIESGELNEMSNKELKNIISSILADDLTTPSRTKQESK
jgi:hypothetical protein